MAWTAPMTFTDATALTASQLNAQLRDNMMETEVAKAQTSNSYFVTDAVNSIVERTPTGASVTGNETTTSTSYTNLSTVGPTVTVETGPRALVFWGCQMRNTSASTSVRMSVQVSGATDIPADDEWAVAFMRTVTDATTQASAHAVFDELTPGVNTFTAKYRVGGGTGSYQVRRLAVFPF